MTATRTPGNFSSVRIGFNVETALDSGGLRALRRLSDALKRPAIICMCVPSEDGGAREAERLRAGGTRWKRARLATAMAG